MRKKDVRTLNHEDTLPPSVYRPHNLTQHCRRICRKNLKITVGQRKSVNTESFTFCFDLVDEYDIFKNGILKNRKKGGKEARESPSEANLDGLTHNPKKKQRIFLFPLQTLGVS